MVEILMQRLQTSGATIVDAVIDSRAARHLPLPTEKVGR
jgi:hypothetical protein